jgi:hypothetical protein
MRLNKQSRGELGYHVFNTRCFLFKYTPAVLMILIKLFSIPFKRPFEILPRR